MEIFKRKKFHLLLVGILLAGKTLAAPKIGVVLGGAVARSYSDIGFLEACEEHGIPINLIVGSSMGSAIGSLYSAGYSIENLKYIAANFNYEHLIDLPLFNRGGLFELRRLEYCLDLLLEKKKYSDLEIPFYATITNFLTGAEQGFCDGSLSKGVLASISIPVLFPPVLIGEDYYIDGGLTNFAPANIAFEKGADLVFVVDVEKEGKPSFCQSLTKNAKQTIWLVMNSFGIPKRDLADLIILPALGDESFMNFPKYESFINEGYLATLRNMETIKALILERDPTFQFIPYQQRGIDEQELSARIKSAYQSASNLTRPLELKPAVTSDPFTDFTKVGLELSRGPLSFFKVGYRHGFSASPSAELLGGFTVPGIDIEMFLRREQQNPSLNWGFAMKQRVLPRLQLLLNYLSVGPYHYQFIALLDPMPNSKNSKFLLSTGVLQKRQPSTLNLVFEPSLQLYFQNEAHSLWEAFLVRPYFGTKLSIKKEVSQSNLDFAYELGLGSEAKLFGLYPFNLYCGIKISPCQGKIWIFGLQTGASNLAK